jgi:SAM-dependent methyltransferase
VRFPVKLCLRLPRGLQARIPLTVRANPRHLIGWPARSPPGDRQHEFSDCVAILGSDAVWKTTHAGRHPVTDRLILERRGAPRPVILDLGVSDGITSLELIEKLGGRFARYFVTDLSFRARYATRGRRVYFLDDQGACTLVAMPGWVVFSRVAGAWPPFAGLARRVLASAPAPAEAVVRELSLVNPALAALAARDPRITVREHSIFAPWPDTPPDVIKVANVLNRAYFTEAQLRHALTQAQRALAGGGRLFVTDNRREERVSVLAKTGPGFELVERVNGGAEVTELALAVR